MDAVSLKKLGGFDDDSAVTATQVEAITFGHAGDKVRNLRAAHTPLLACALGLAARRDGDSIVINSRIAMVYTWLNNTAKAYEYFDRANDLHATGELHDIAYAFLLAGGGQLEMSRNLTFEAVEDAGVGTEWIDPVYAALTAALADSDNRLELTEAALDAVRDAWKAETQVRG